ncbi:MAG: beta-ketoacyl-ACP synthase II [Neomegalonema sp.]|nr:beta-ketoacyl-ACP synthase II [Neomegalonema sp.]
MRRVVVTGLGLVSPLACGVEASWSRLIAGESGAGPITAFEASDLPCRIANFVPRDGDNAFIPDEWIDKREQRRNDTFILYALAAAEQALADANWKPGKDEDEALLRTGVLVGSGIGGLPYIEETAITMHERGPRKVSPFFIPGSLINLCSGQISIKHGFKGPNHSVVTACSTGAHAIGDATRLIQRGEAEVMVAGGAEAAICRLGIAGFAACKALSTNFNDEPTRASRPYDKARDGFVMGEGAGVLILEELEHARARGAKIYAEVLGYGLSGDAYHVTSPAPDGDGGFRSMSAALADAKLEAGAIDYINAHGTSTPMGDEIELKAVARLLGDAGSQATMSSTKSAIGHLLGAAGAVEAIFCILALRDSIAPATLNLEDPSVETTIDLAPLKPVERKIKTALSNSFGFGGTNASLVIGEAPSV